MTGIIFHCGLPKTGTTAIQEFLHENQEALDHLISFPGTNEETGNASWMTPLIWANQITALVEYCKRNHTAGKLTLFSSEDLYHAWRISPAAFVKLVEELDALVIIYLPSITDFMVGSVKQLIRGHCHTQLEADARLKVMCNYTESLIHIYQHLGKDRLKCFSYDRSQFPSGDVVAHFLEVIGIKTSTLSEPLRRQRDANISLSPLALGLLVHMAQGGMTLIPEKEQFFVRELIQRFSEENISTYPPQSTLVKEEASAFIENNERIINEVFEFETSKSVRTNKQIYFPIAPQCWQDFIQFISTHDSRLINLLSRLHENACHYNKMTYSPPGGYHLAYSTSELGFRLNASNYACWQGHKSLTSSPDGYLHIEPCKDTVFVDLPRAYPISKMKYFLEIFLLEPTITTPYLYWTTEITPYLSDENCKPMQLLDSKSFRTEVTHPLFNGGLAIRFSTFPNTIVITRMEMGFLASI